MPGSVYLDGDTVALRAVEREDLPVLGALYNHPEVRIYDGGPPGPFNGDSMEEYYDRVVCKEGTTHLLICAEGEVVGTISLEPKQLRDAEELGYIVGPDNRREGYGSAACELLLDYAFDHRGTHKVVASVFDFNDASMGLLEKLGFREEGVHRKERFAFGEYVDVHYYGLLAEEWREQ